MRCHHGNHSDQSDFEVRKTPNLDLQMTKTCDGRVRGRPMACHYGNQTDQSDFEVRETLDLDLRETLGSDGQVRSGERSTNEVSPW